MAKDIKDAVLREYAHLVWYAKKFPHSQIAQQEAKNYYNSIPALKEWLKESKD